MSGSDNGDDSSSGGDSGGGNGGGGGGGGADDEARYHRPLRTCRGGGGEEKEGAVRHGERARGSGLSGLVEVGGLHQENAEPTLLNTPALLCANGADVWT